MRIVPMRFADAAKFVDENHRHHRAPVGHKFSIGVEHDGILIGVALVGRPVARMLDDGLTLEVNRSCVIENSQKGANSMLYGAAARAAAALGYQRILTYTQAGESGASLRGAGWTRVAVRPPRTGWNNRPSRRVIEPIERVLWMKRLGKNPPPSARDLHIRIEAGEQQ